MKAISIVFAVILLFQTKAGASDIQPNDSIKIVSISTGETTGHIADLYISHSSNEVEEFSLKPSYIPSRDGYQSYLTLTDTILLLEPHIETRIPLRAYCADLFVDPVPLKKNLPAYSLWVEIDVNRDKNQFNPDKGKWVKDSNSRILNPKNSQPLNLAIESEKHPEEIAWLMWHTLITLESSYKKLFSEKLIKTPYSLDKTQERNGLVQHSFWIFTSELSGKYYLKEHFEEGIERQYFKSNITFEESEQISKGVSQFWTAFHLLLHRTSTLDIYKINTHFVKDLDEEIQQLKIGETID